MRPTVLLAGVVLLGACASGGARRAPSDPRFQMGEAGAVARASADSARYPYTKADIDFMTGMIHHHAQAITISRWAPSHAASPAVQRLTARIVNAQSDEIVIMQTWLKDRRQPVPTVDSLGTVTMPAGAAGGHDMHAGHDMAGMSMDMGPGKGGAGQMAMPGMLTAGQLRELDAARGPEFDRLFLTYMIQHHRGAVAMVKTLFSSNGAGQDETIFKFANDVEVDQGTEIKRMMTMMLEMGFIPPMP